METNQDFGGWLKEVREDMGLNQSQMAELVGYDQSHLSKVERGKKAATEGLCVALARAVGLPPTYVLIKAGFIDEDQGNKDAQKESPTMRKIRALIAFLDTDDQEAAAAMLEGLVRTRKRKAGTAKARAGASGSKVIVKSG